MTHEVLYMIGFLILAHCVESVLGFGATIIAFGLGAHFFPVEKLIVMLVLLALLQSAFLMARWFRHIEWGRVFRFIIPVSLIGVIGGILIRNQANEGILKLILGIFIISISILEIFLLLYSKKTGQRELSLPAGFVLVLTGGLFHGLLAIGGPLIVYYASRKLSSQESIRGTLAFLWIILNITMVAGFIVNGRITPDIMTTTALFLPGVLLGIGIGQILKIGDLTFKIVTYVLLCIIGTVLVLT